MRDVIPSQNLRAGQHVGVSHFRGAFTEAEVLAVAPQSNHLGGRWAVLTLRLPDGETVEGVDTRSHVIVGPEDHRTAWCVECRSRVEVEDASDESAYVGPHEHGYYVERLACGHANQHDRGIIGASPGGESAAEATQQAETQARLARTAIAYDGAEA